MLHRAALALHRVTVTCWASSTTSCLSGFYLLLPVSSRVSFPLFNLNIAMPTCSNTMLPFGLKNWKNTLANSGDELFGKKPVSHFFLNFNSIKCLNFAFNFTWFYFSAGLEWEGTEDSQQGPAGQMVCFQDWLVFPGYFLSCCCFCLMIFLSHQQLPAQAVLGQSAKALLAGNHGGNFISFLVCPDIPDLW